MTFKRLSAEGAHALISEQQANVVDIRDDASYAAGHINVAKHVDGTTIQQLLAELDPDTPLVVCCYHGNTSQQAAQYFVEQGFEDVYSLDGGFEQWRIQYPGEIKTTN